MWSICIATLASRKLKLARLLDVLLPQAEAVWPQVEVLALHNNGERGGPGPVKQDLLMAATGEYFSIVDDDDMVEPDYVPVILAAMWESGADYIAFDHAYYHDGARHPKTVRTGLDMPGWGNRHLDQELPYLARDVTQVNPVRLELARQGDFTAKSAGFEDWSWVEMVRPLLKTQARIDRILYHYYYNSGDTNQRGLAPHTYDERLAVNSPVFRWVEASSLWVAVPRQRNWLRRDGAFVNWKPNWKSVTS